MRSPAYQEWQQQSNTDTRVRGPDDGWYEHIKWAHDASPPSPFQEVATMWLDTFGALGWLLAREPGGATLTVQEVYRHFSVDRPLVTWFQEIFQLAWPEVNALVVNQQERAAAFTFLEKVGEAKNHFEAGFRYIREHYEGGDLPSETFFPPEDMRGLLVFLSP